MKNFFKFTPPNDTNAFRIAPPSKNNENNQFDKNTELSKYLNINLDILKKLLNYPKNTDIVFREFNTKINDKEYASFLVFYDGFVDSQLIDNFILKPLIHNTNTGLKNLDEIITKNILPQNQLQETSTYKEVIDGLLAGNCIFFIDQLNIAYSSDVKNLPQRSVAPPVNEMTIKGPMEAFIEILRTNTALIRRYVKDENLVFENIEIGQKGKTQCCIAYISDITNDSLINEVKRRLENVDIDYLLDSGQLEQFIEDKTYTTLPLILSTERPDKVASHLFEGRIAIIVNGSPNVLIVPAILTDFMHASEDSYIRYPYTILLRIFRIPAILMSVLLPGLYLAITTFHQEMIPTDLLFAIAATREKVPFPFLIELLIIEFAFEIIREASIRTPAPIGPTLGIVGTLILGQAIVSANVVSPILIIIVAITGISAFTVANFALNYTFRILRFVYIFLRSHCPAFLESHLAFLFT